MMLWCVCLSWKNREDVVEMHGNNSFYGWWSTRLCVEHICQELLATFFKILIKTPFTWAWNFDDTEPTVFTAAAFPNLLVNGATGFLLVATYGTFHHCNLSKSSMPLSACPSAKLDKLMEFLPGQISQQGISFRARMRFVRPETGKGRVVVRSPCTEIVSTQRW